MVVIFSIFVLISAVSGADLITQAEFQKTFSSSGYPVPSNLAETHRNLLKAIPKAKISTRNELAMFLANIFHESAGLKYKRELNPREASFYNGGLRYIGRGFIQLTHKYNYAAASKYLFNDDRLVQNPEQVEKDEISWLTTCWFWAVNVHPKASEFESTIRAVNPLELAPGATTHEKQQAQHRRDLFRTISGILSGTGGDNVIIHTVQAGESLWSIGQKYGVPYQKIAKDNGITDAASLKVGQKLKIIKGSSDTTSDVQDLFGGSGSSLPGFGNPFGSIGFGSNPEFDGGSDVPNAHCEVPCNVEKKDNTGGIGNSAPTDIFAGVNVPSAAPTGFGTFGSGSGSGGIENAFDVFGKGGGFGSAVQSPSAMLGGMQFPSLSAMTR